jgi:predicted 3-demethylubiquinone-9 3-methyltransferase (glyoxalase superfamily)
VSRVKTFLMFRSGAEDAVRLYTSVIPNSRITRATDLGDAPDFGQGPGPRMVVLDFELDGVPYTAMDGGSDFHFAQGMSIYVRCDTQAEIDDRTARLLAGGGQQGPCGWLTDRFGVSWQIVPGVLDELLGDKDPVKAKRALDAMLKMQKLDIAELRRAHAGQGTATPRT